jgi:uncharacterized protein (TIGR02996 family)
MSIEDAFIQAILSDPRAAAPRLIYADWLEERGESASICRAEYLRVECEWDALLQRDPRRPTLQARLQELRPTVGDDWWRQLDLARLLSPGFGRSGGEGVSEPYFPEEAVSLLRAARYDPAARPGLELVSGSFIWHDEGYLEFVPACRARGCLAYWEPVAFRSSFILGQPDERYRRGWEELRRLCPEWPGFRPGRYSGSLRPELERQLAEEA